MFSYHCLTVSSAVARMMALRYRSPSTSAYRRGCRRWRRGRYRCHRRRLYCSAVWPSSVRARWQVSSASMCSPIFSWTSANSPRR
ncbi:hypothetical protein AR457_27300 [Streptomyces agglomeratus]|uniref:Uncharacterized protein n=1 Tax=Streptomyces agglomeratus TaxID=285458 RepID=A0A1E5PDK9_9ACTN|nr:hypothetical protein AS594_27170 [Streptomyces agglomeratus]OEJ38323.1 hypothetical protein BGK70_09355 [Streptomyces agglomeratus]OEJ47293.1 hypothetical protein AR457_27300 [Streptomyces agglomeratus]OEJ50851.1 hypothetical protein BGK72_08840 [Streptomyces agglomeratus]OEJ58214.1 hypothetical protein BGM19_09705 [Streptomyces agglomeratus]